jgi:hypothetical protein
VEVRKQALGERHPAYASSLNDLAMLYYCTFRELVFYTKASP